MRVLFDADIFTTQRRGGISTYFSQLITAFMGHPELRVSPDLPLALVTAAQLHASHTFKQRPAAMDDRSALRINEFLLRAHSVLRPTPEIYHSTYYYRPLRKMPAKARVVTIHDMIPELFPQYFEQPLPHQHKRDHAERADLLIFVSESAKHDLEQVYGTLKQPSAIVPLAVSSFFKPAIPSQPRQSGPDPYLLFVGRRETYKNFGAFLETCAILRHEGINGVIAGPPLSVSEVDVIQRMDLNNTVCQVSPSDERLRELYRSAIALIFPSRYEGFGLPTLEAMACGCPAILSNTPALREVADSAGLYFEPDDALRAADIVRRLRDDPQYRTDVRTRGLERASLFTWIQAAHQTAAAYANVQ